ncbi:MAG: hypothetical protein RSA40_01595 [Malacoplasma sp.]
MFFKFKINDENNKSDDEPSSPIISIASVETFNILKNKNNWILLRENEERPIYFSSSKNDVINKAKDFSFQKKYKINIFNVRNELINTKILIKN